MGATIVYLEAMPKKTLFPHLTPPFHETNFLTLCPNAVMITYH